MESLKKALRDRLAKAKYIKRWKGADGKWKYKYKEGSEREPSKEQERADRIAAKKERKKRNIDEKTVRKMLDDIQMDSETMWRGEMDPSTEKMIDQLVAQGLVSWDESGYGEYNPVLTKKGKAMLKQR